MQEYSGPGRNVMVIDGHAHTYPDHAADKVVSSFVKMHRMEPTSSLGSGTVAQLREKMRENGVDYTVLANFGPARNLKRINEWTLSMAHLYTDLIPLISVVPCMDIEEVRAYFNQGAKGIKMHNGIQDFDPDDPGLSEIYAWCNENRIAVTFHCGETSRVHLNEYAEICHILNAVEKYENIPFVLTHLAAGDPDTVLSIAEKYPNVIFDTSITFSGEHCIRRIHDDFWESDENTVSLIRKAGAGRFAFGSDYPFGNPGSDIRRFKRLNLSEEEKEMILGRNTYRLYFPQVTPEG